MMEEPAAGRHDRSAAGKAESRDNQHSQTRPNNTVRFLRGRPTASGTHRCSEPETARGSDSRRASESPREKERS